MTASAVASVFVSSAVMRGGAQSLAARTRSCSSVGLAGVGVFALVGSGCAVRSRRLARIRASALSVVAALHADEGSDFRSETHPAGGPWRYE